MSDKDEGSDAGLDDFDKTARLSFRDYPSTSLVMLAALSSGLGWMLYKWRGRRRAGQPAVPDSGGRQKAVFPKQSLLPVGAPEAERDSSSLCSGAAEKAAFSPGTELHQGTFRTSSGALMPWLSASASWDDTA